jgi:hypothetical protein
MLVHSRGSIKYKYRRQPLQYCAVTASQMGALGTAQSPSAYVGLFPARVGDESVGYF